MPLLFGIGVMDSYDLNILSTACLEEDEAHVMMLDQQDHVGEVTALVLWILTACTAAVGATYEPASCYMEVLK